MVFLSNYLVFKIVLAALGRVDYPVAGDLELKYDTANKIYLSGGSLDYVDDATLYTTIGGETTSYDIQFNSLNLDASNEQILFANDAEAGDELGNSCDVYGEYAVVGAPKEDTNGVSNAGSVYVYHRSGNTWTQQAKLTASDGEASDLLGGQKGNLAIYGDTVVVGARDEDTGGSAAGSAYVFVRSGTTWSQQAILRASNAGASDQFATGVAIYKDTIVIGAPTEDTAASDGGSLYVFTRSGTTWTQRAQLQTSNAGASDRLGDSVSIDGDTIIAGTQYEDTTASDAGSAYIFTGSGATWTQQAQIQASDAAATDYFGYSVSISGNTVVVGARYDDDGGTNSGSAYVFVRSGTTWTQQAKLTASDAQADDDFGWDVDIDKDHIVVAAPREDTNASDAGAVYVFSRSGSTWTEIKKIRASITVGSINYLGYGGAAIHDGTIITAAPNESTKATYAGAAYIYGSQKVTNYYITDAGKYSVDATIAGLNYKTNEVEVTGSIQAVTKYTDNETDFTASKAVLSSTSSISYHQGGMSDNGEYYYYGQQVYKKDTGSFTYTTYGSALSSTIFSGSHSSISHDGNYIVSYYTNSTQQLHIIKNNGSTFTSHQIIASPNSSARNDSQATFVPGPLKHFVWVERVSNTTNVTFHFYKYNSSTDNWALDFSVTNPTGLTTSSTGYWGRGGISFSRDGNYLAVSYNTNPGAAVFKVDWTNQTLTLKYQNSQTGFFACFLSSDAKYFYYSTGSGTTAGKMLYSANGDWEGTPTDVTSSFTNVGNLGDHSSIFSDRYIFSEKGGSARYIFKWNDLIRPTLTFDGYNKLSMTNTPTNTSSKLFLGSNVYDIGTLTSDLTIETPGLYRGLVFDTSSNVAYFNKTTVGAIASTMAGYEKQDQVLDAGTDAGYSNGDASQGGYGNSIDMSADGTRMVVGNAHYTDSNGRVWLYHLENGLWVLKQTWDGGTRLGSQVAMNEAGTRVFAIYTGGGVKIWDYSSGVWDTSASGTYAITPGTISGEVPAVDCNKTGDVVIIGSGNRAGTATWIYRLSGGSWSSEKNFDRRGSGVSMNGDGTRCFMGDRNSHKVWESNYSGGSWGTETEIISESSFSGYWPASLSTDSAGETVCIKGGDSGNGAIYERAGNGSWSASVSGILSRTEVYGTDKVALSYDGTMALFGHMQNPNALSTGGHALLYTKSGSTWTLTQTLLNPSTSQHSTDYFGSGTGLAKTAKDRFVVAAMGDDNAGTNYGAIYTYTNAIPDFINFDTYNKLTLKDITNPTSKLHVLPTGAESTTTYDIGTATNIYIESEGTYTVAMKGSDGFALDSNVVGSLATNPLVNYRSVIKLDAGVQHSSFQTATICFWAKALDTGPSYFDGFNSDRGFLQLTIQETYTHYASYGVINQANTSRIQGYTGTSGNSVYSQFNSPPYNDGYDPAKWNFYIVYTDSNGGTSRIYLPEFDWTATSTTYGRDHTWLRFDIDDDHVALTDVSVYTGNPGNTDSWRTTLYNGGQIGGAANESTNRVHYFRFHKDNLRDNEGTAATDISSSAEMTTSESLPGYSGAPSLTFDTYNKLTFTGADTGSTYKLKYESNTYDLGTISNVYIAYPGTYSAEIKGATNFGLSSNVTSGTITPYKVLWKENEDQILYASDAAASDHFGWTISLSGDYAIVGAYNKNSATGAAYIYTRNTSTGVWGDEQKIQASDKAGSDYFGYSVSLSGDYAIVGAYGEDTGGSQAGAAYIYKRNASTGVWGDEQKIQASDKASSDYFGWSVSLSGDYAIVGAYNKNSATGAAYIYTRNTSTGVWGDEQKIQASDKAGSDYFGYSVSLSGDYAIVGAYGEDTGGSAAGAVYIYTRNTSTGVWGDEQKIQASDKAGSDSFGKSVSINGDYAIVGAYRKDSYTGAAYIYTRNGTTWSEQQKIEASDKAVGDEFGWSISINSNYAIVGAWRKDDTGGTDAGAVYIFERSGTTWTEVKRITASDGQADDNFGYSVAIDGTNVFVGARDEDTKGSDAGAAYVYKKVNVLDFDGYNKLTFSGLESGSTSNVTFNGNTYSIGTASNVYITETGTYEAESKGTTTFALTKNVVSGSIIDKPYNATSIVSWTNLGTTLTSDTNNITFSGYVDWDTTGTVSTSFDSTNNAVVFGGGNVGLQADFTSLRSDRNSNLWVEYEVYLTSGDMNTMIGLGKADGGNSDWFNWNGYYVYVRDANVGTSTSSNDIPTGQWVKLAWKSDYIGSGNRRVSALLDSGNGYEEIAYHTGAPMGAGSNYLHDTGVLSYIRLFYTDGNGGASTTGNKIRNIHIFSDQSDVPTPPPKLTHDGYKLVVKNITPTSTTLKYGSNTYEIGSATNIYVENTGAYTAEIGGAADFAFTSNTVSGTIKTIEPGFASRYQGSMALTYDGKLYAWGMNDDGEAGVGTSSDITVPTLCTGITQGTVAKLLSSSDLTDNSRGEVSAIKTTDGKIYMAGKGDNNCIPGKTSDQTSFTDVTSYFGDQSLTANTVTMMSFTDASGAALTETGNVWTWGTHDSTYKRLGQASASSSSTPKQINFSSATDNITKVTCGHYHTVALDSSGDVWFWGKNGINSTSWPSSITDEPQKVVDGKNIIGLSQSYGTMYAWDATGKMWNAGNNYEGQIGDGTTTANSSGKTLTEVTYFSSKGITINKVYGGGYFVFADTSDGYYCWGNGGQWCFW